jgi:hypothetical protein
VWYAARRALEQKDPSPSVTYAANLAGNAASSDAPVNAGDFTSTTDFLMLGGLTILLFLLLQFIDLTGLDKEVSIGYYYRHFAVIFPSLQLFVNWPHAMFSYRFAYQQGGSFIWRHRYVLLWLPLLLAIALFVSIPLWNASMQQFPGILAVDRALQHVGIFINASLYRGFGQFMLASLLVAQAITIGWHYAMQAFGVSLACAHSQGYPVSANQRVHLRNHMLALWLMNALSGFNYFHAATDKTFEYYTPRFPELLTYATYIGVVVTAALLWQKVIWPIRQKEGKWPPLSSITTVVATWLWLQPFWYPFGFQLWVVPFGHGLQYLAFVYRVERNNAGGLFKVRPAESAASGHKKSSNPLRMVPLLVLIFIFGFLSFQGLPEWLDNIRVYPFLSASFFIIAAEVFINLHHYWIDSIVWRSPDSRMRQLVVNTTS